MKGENRDDDLTNRRRESVGRNKRNVARQNIIYFY